MVGVGVPDDPMWTTQGDGFAVFNPFHRYPGIVCEKIIDFSLLGWIPFTKIHKISKKDKNV